MRIEALIDLHALQHNLAQIKSWFPQKQILAMVKANAYGHGLLSCAKVLDADFLGVATLEEARSLRLHGISKRIVLMSGFQDQEELKAVRDLELDSVIYHAHQVALLETQKNQKNISKIPIWFKVDTGMHRLGFSMEEAGSNLKKLSQLQQVEVVCLLSHLACGDCKAHPHLLEQFDAFEAFTKNFSYPKSFLNSAGLLHYPEYAYDILRPGVMLYGASPIEGKTAKDLGLKPVMTLKSKVLSLMSIKKGEPVGYGATWTAARDSKIAVIACGYGDGYPQHPQHAKVYYQGQHVAVIGRVSMDYLSVDVSEVKKIAIGDDVELWGEHWPVNEAAQAIDTSVYALLTGLMPRVERIEIGLAKGSGSVV